MVEEKHRKIKSVYSGRFVVYSDYKDTIVIKHWDGFGRVQPSRGFIVPQASAGSVYYSGFDVLPDAVTAEWVVDGDHDSRVYSQEINLKGVIPIGVDGYTVFYFNEEGVWDVKFMTGAKSSSEAMRAYQMQDGREARQK